MTTAQFAHVTSYLLTWEQFAGDTFATEITTEDKDKCIALTVSGSGGCRMLDLSLDNRVGWLLPEGIAVWIKLCNANKVRNETSTIRCLGISVDRSRRRKVTTKLSQLIMPLFGRNQKQIGLRTFICGDPGTEFPRVYLRGAARI